MVNIWARGATKVQIGFEGSLPYEDKIWELSILVWVLLGIHCLQFLLQTPILKADESEEAGM
jgi:hypothetical protein